MESINSLVVFANIDEKLLQLSTLKDVKSTSSNFSQEENILSILVTFSVLKLDKSKFAIEVQLSNISLIFSTFFVSNEFISSSSKLSIPLNIPDISFTLLVS